MNGLMRGLRGAVLLGAGISISACSQLGGLGNVLGGVLQPSAGSGSGTGSASGTVRYVDTQRGQLQLTTSSGQTGTVYFDNRTQVVYQQQQYPVTALEQGDQVQLQLQQDQQGNYYTPYILVTRSVQESNGGYNTGGYNNGSSALVQAEGRVTWIDYQNGQFGVDSNRGTLTVRMPYNASASAANYFRNLRQGSSVRLEGQMVSNGQLQLTRFY
jgi:hypothetical protein